MPRPRRLQDAGYVFHVIARGNNKEVIFRDRHDKLFFCSQAVGARKSFPVKIYNYCLMDNHIHLLVESLGYGSVSEFMHRLLGTYARWFNEKYDHVGHVFQGRYKSFVIQTEKYFMRCSRYIDRNAFEAGVVDRAEEYEFCAYRYLVEGRAIALNVDVHELYERLGATLPLRRQVYRAFVFSTEDTDFDLMKRPQGVLGDRSFRRKIQHGR